MNPWEEVKRMIRLQQAAYSEQQRAMQEQQRAMQERQRAMQEQQRAMQEQQDRALQAQREAAMKDQYETRSPYSLGLPNEERRFNMFGWRSLGPPSQQVHVKFDDVLKTNYIPEKAEKKERKEPVRKLELED